MTYNTKPAIKLLVCTAVLFSQLGATVIAEPTAKKIAPLNSEPVMKIERLPEQYPSSWFFAHDANFQSLIAGKVVIMDSAADTKEYKAAIDAAQFATFVESRALPELYVAESFYSRGTRGARTDVVTVYDKSTLQRKAEIILPGNKRSQVVTNKHNMRLIDNDKYLVIFNFTPASSATIIDTANKKVLNEINMPGCNMIYPNGPRGFSSLCGDGSMVSVQIDEQGKEVSRELVPSFFSVDDDPVFDKPSYINGVAYFVTYLGNVIPVDMTGDVPKVLTTWSLLDEKGRNGNWRPSGWQVSAGGNGKLYVIMSPDGFDGSHKSGGEQIWVYDITSKKRVLTIKATIPAFSLELLNTQPETLVVTNVLMGVDILDAKGKLQRSFTVGDSAMPLVLHGVRN